MNRNKELVEKKFEELFLDDATKDVSYEKLKNLNSGVIHNLRTTYNAKYHTRYTDEEFFDKLLNSFKQVVVQQPVVTSKGLMLPADILNDKCIYNRKLIFKGLYKMPDTKYIFKKDVTVDDSTEYNAMNMWDLYCKRDDGIKYDFETGKKLGHFNMFPFKHQSATCCVAPSGKMLAKYNGNLVTGENIVGNDALTLEDLFVFIFTDYLENMDKAELEAYLANYLSDDMSTMVSFVAFRKQARTPVTQFISDLDVLRKNGIARTDRVVAPDEVDNFILDNIFCIENSTKAKTVQSLTAGYKKFYTYNRNGVDFTFYYNPLIFSNRVQALTLEDYIYLRDILLYAIHGLHPEYKGQVRPGTTNKNFSMTKDGQGNPNRIVLKGYELVMPLIQRVEIANKTRGTYYYQCY